MDHRSGRYGSYSCDCATTEEGKRKIRNAVAPQRTKKTYTPKQRRHWTYTDTNGKPLIRTVRLGDGKGEKDIWQEYCVNGQWLTPSNVEEKGIELDQTAYADQVALLYYKEVQNAIAPVNIDNLATRYLGTDNPLFDTFLKKTLIAAVARMYEPGAQHDTVLILKGDQGLGKTNFFRILAGDYFDNSFSGNNERDDLLNLHRAWVKEWGEVAKVFRKKEVDDLKHFITKTEDAFREPYGRKTQRYKRKCYHCRRG